MKSLDREELALLGLIVIGLAALAFMSLKVVSQRGESADRAATIASEQALPVSARCIDCSCRPTSQTAA